MDGKISFIAAFYVSGGRRNNAKQNESVFNFSKPEDMDFKRCWALSNLQPLWAADNFSKHAKLKKPFQPSMF